MAPKQGLKLILATWFEARRLCIALNGDLASIRSKEEQDRINTAVNQYRVKSFWIGANDMKREGRFEWSDGSPFSFTNWWAREPNNRGSRGQEDCVHLKSSRYRRKWNDLACSFKHPFICKIPY